MKSITIELPDITHEDYKTIARNRDNRDMKGQTKHLVENYIKEHYNEVIKKTRKSGIEPPHLNTL